MRKIYLLTCILVTLSGAIKAQVVSPLQAGHYFPGFINVRDETAPPPGFFIIFYNAYMWSDTYVDRNGNKFNNLDLSKIDPRLPNINLNMKIQSFANVPVLAWASSFKILGATYLPMVILPSYTYAEASIFGELAWGVIDTTITFSDRGKVSGFGDMLVQPVGLSWAGNKTDFMFTYGIYIPSGRYSTGADDNIGLGYWTHQFQTFGYYYPIEDKSTALMLGLTYETNGYVVDADLKPGDRFTLEWGISQYLSERFELSVQGGHNWQVGADKGADIWWDPSVYDKKSTMAFSVNYWVVSEKLYLALKYGFDFGVRQRFKANFLSLNLIYAPGILTGKKG